MSDCEAIPTTPTIDKGAVILSTANSSWTSDLTYDIDQ